MNFSLLNSTYFALLNQTKTQAGRALLEVDSLFYLELLTKNEEAEELDLSFRWKLSGYS